MRCWRHWQRGRTPFVRRACGSVGPRGCSSHSRGACRGRADTVRATNLGRSSPMTARHTRFPIVAASLLATAAPAMAHHSMAAFDTTQTVSLEGVVTRFEWANPHVYIWLSAADADGKTVEWEVEGQPPSMLRRLGWSRETLTVGDAVQA